MLTVINDDQDESFLSQSIHPPTDLIQINHHARTETRRGKLNSTGDLELHVETDTVLGELRWKPYAETIQICHNWLTFIPLEHRCLVPSSLIPENLTHAPGRIN